MATPGDFSFLTDCIDQGTISGSVLEVGSYARQGNEGNASGLLRRRGLEWTGTDIDAGPGVDFTLDLLDRDAVDQVEGRWDTVLVMNVLEHVYDPISALRNACALVKHGGHCIVVTPAIWQLHDYPKDYCRLLPDFYEEFCDREGHRYVAGQSRWIAGEGLHRVDSEVEQKVFPSNEAVFGKGRWFVSRVVNRLFNTAARQIFFPYVALGVAIQTGPVS